MHNITTIGQKKTSLPNSIWRLVDLVYPPLCCCCGKLGYEICPTCFSEISLLPITQICQRCGDTIFEPDPCDLCKSDPPSFDQQRSWGYYTGNLQRVIQMIKYNRAIGLVEYLQASLIHYIQVWGITFDLIIPVPLGKKRQKKRGFNQSEQIAKPIASRLGIPFSVDAIKRIRETPSQVGLTIKERQENVRGAFDAFQEVCAEKDILLVDDISTTGATLNACSKALKAAGAAHVFCFTVAKTNKEKK